MKSHITDKDALSTPIPRSVRIYMRSHGWVPSVDEAGLIKRWTLRVEDDEYQVDTPTSKASRDYPQRIADLLATLTVVEDRPESDVLRDLTTVAYDVQYVRTQPGTPTGTSPISDAVDAFRHAQSMIVAAATTLDDPRAVLPNRKSVRTTEFIRRVLAGPTREGSFVLSLLIPVPPRLSTEEDLVLFDDPNVPYERQVTTRLHEALRATLEAATLVNDVDEGIEAFTSRVNLGVSANLCEALVGLSGERRSGIEVSFGWALDRPRVSTEPIIFGSDLIPLLESAGQEIRRLEPESDVEIRGYVTRLHREGTGSGDVTIAGSLVDDPDERIRRVTASLAESDYQKAIEAHKDGQSIEIIGTLERRGTRTYLKNGRGFTLIRDSESDDSSVET